MDRWRQYLFESHSEATLRAWAKQLKLFRFFRAYGGHANDGDSLDVAFHYDSLEELREFFALLGVSLNAYVAEPPQPEPGRPYPGDVFAAFPSVIPGTRWLEQPGRCKIGGHSVFAWCESQQITLSVGSDWCVTASDVQSAAAVERELAGVRLRRIDPPADNQHYICPKYYPEYFD